MIRCRRHRRWLVTGSRELDTWDGAQQVNDTTGDTLHSSRKTYLDIDEPMLIQRLPEAS